MIVVNRIVWIITDTFTPVQVSMKSSATLFNCQWHWIDNNCIKEWFPHFIFKKI